MRRRSELKGERVRPPFEELFGKAPARDEDAGVLLVLGFGHRGLLSLSHFLRPHPLSIQHSSSRCSPLGCARRLCYGRIRSGFRVHTAAQRRRANRACPLAVPAFPKLASCHLHALGGRAEVFTPASPVTSQKCQNSSNHETGREPTVNESRGIATVLNVDHKAGRNIVFAKLKSLSTRRDRGGSGATAWPQPMARMRSGATRRIPAIVHGRAGHFE